MQHIHTLASRSYIYILYNSLLFCNLYIDWFHGHKYTAFLIQRFLHQQAIANCEQGWSQNTFLNTETPAYQFQGEGGFTDVIHHSAIIS